MWRSPRSAVGISSSKAASCSPNSYPQHLSTESFQIFGYPLATVIAEKLSTAVALGDLNTRDRDYADLFRLISLHDLHGGDLTAALNATADHRGISLKPLSTSITDLAERRQSSYAAWRRRQGSAASGYPGRFAYAIDLVCAFADPLLAGEVTLRNWMAAKGTWS
ncbi:nucleotidyl transferase AbiEii/AbiGii toxin family protein [Nonomuraea harbinensis]|uniref:Nucleotidyl transferase AbiEii/AbiGii toxin family protein n=1 Tax=Nonomuraea harbinensis TaxID=1286938 RepID=A0ABW1BVK5_9ACTN|nr:nucleotidyl transferase AbiEii/AbiGii toxin family protein [Nonomuraea harbinensis]